MVIVMWYIFLILSSAQPLSYDSPPEYTLDLWQVFGPQQTYFGWVFVYEKKVNLGSFAGKLLPEILSPLTLYSQSDLMKFY